MVTSIQVDEKTLLLLKKLKEELNTQSYDETINKIVIQRTKEKFKSIGGSLKKYYKNKPLKEILNELQKERRESDRF